MQPLNHYQELLNRYHRGDGGALLQLLQARICPSCGCTTLALDSAHLARGGIPRAVCLHCAWDYPRNVILKLIPQSLLAWRDAVSQRAEGVRSLVRRSILNGAYFEPGRFGVRVAHSEIRQLSMQTIRTLLDENTFALLARSLPYSTRLSVIVRSNGDSPAPVFTPASYAPSDLPMEETVEPPAEVRDPLAFA